MRITKRRLLTTGRVLMLVALFGVVFGANVQAQDSVSNPDLFELGDGQPPPGMPGMADVLDDSALSGPDWVSLFTAGGTARDDLPLDANGDPAGNGIPDYKELYSGQWVVFTADDISLGTGLETTALAGGGRIKNGVADADHDLGNAYVYSATSPAGNLVLYAGVERLGDGPSSLELEFNQDHFRLGHGGYGRGEPWAVDGERAVGDILVKLTFQADSLGTLEASSWDGQAWTPITNVSGEGCDLDETFCTVRNSTVIDGGPWTNHDTGADPELISVNRFVEVGVNVGALLGTQPSYTTVRLRTPQDAAFGYFAEGN